MAYNKAMRTEPADLLRDALSLPAEARAALIDSLLESLDVDADDDVEVDENAQEAWRAEIHRRLQQIDTEAVRMIPWDDARHALRSGLQR
jgi:putative addiction module component (TIGR02574 family)